MNSSNRSFSPFLNAKPFLSCMRFIVGFPLTPLNKNFDLFEFKPFWELIRYLMFIAVFLASGVCTGVIYSSSKATGNISSAFMERLKGFGFTGLDVAVINLLPPLNIASNTIYFFSFKAIVFKLNKISSLLFSLNEDFHKVLKNDLFDSFEEKEKAQGFKFYWNLIYVSVAPLVATVLITLSFAAIAFEDDTVEFSTLQKIIFCVALGIFGICYIYPPSAISADYVVCLLLSKAKEMCEKYSIAMDVLENTDRIHSGLQRKPPMQHNKMMHSGTPDIIKTENKPMEENSNDTEQEKIVITVGFNLIKLIKRIDKACAPMIINTYFICILVATCEFYLGSSALFYRGKYEVTLLSIAGLSTAWLAIFRVHQMTKQGHGLTVLMKKCSFHLDRIHFKDPDNLSSGVVQLLREDFRNNSDSLIAPYSAFTLSYSSLLGFFGTIVTYIIVLLQFKTS